MYELMVIGKADDGDSLYDKIEKLIKGANASSLAGQKLGKKTLSYPIKKQTEAEYFVFNFEAPGESIKTISDALRLEQEAVLRYMIVKQKVTKVKAVVAKKEEKKDNSKTEVDTKAKGKRTAKK